MRSTRPSRRLPRALTAKVMAGIMEMMVLIVLLTAFQGEAASLRAEKVRRTGDDDVTDGTRKDRNVKGWEDDEMIYARAYATDGHGTREPKMAADEPSSLRGTPPQLPRRNTVRFPEASMLKHKNNVGICFSGGGTRSYSTTLGYLRALLDLKLLKHVRYVSSVSGGSWALAGFTYHNPEVTNTETLEKYLGEVTPPEKLTMETVKTMPPLGTARSFPVRKNIVYVVLEQIARGTSLSDVWTKAVHEVFLKPAGIPFHALPAFSRAQVSRVLQRNPSLLNDPTVSFALPCGGAEPCDSIPFLIVNTAMLGPTSAAPFGLLNRRYVMMEATPMYVGFPKSMNVSYPSGVEVKLGGVVEPIGFGAPTRREYCGFSDTSCPTSKREEDEERGGGGGGGGGSVDAGEEEEEEEQDEEGPALYTMKLPKPRFPFSLANATASSSWAPGAVVAEEPLLKSLDGVLMTAPYFSPAYGGESTTLFFGDGANMENQGFIALLRRNVRSVVMFCNSATPLANRAQYHPYLRPPYEDVDVDGSFAALFGVRGMLPPIGEDFVHDQVFSYFDFPRVVAALQDSQLKGKGAVASVVLTTVRNEWWGVEGGHKVKCTFVYLSRAYEWENLLPDATARYAAPARGTKPHLQDPKVLPSNGTFKSFPHIPMSDLHLTAPVVNMLGHLAGWVVKANEEIFRRAIQDVSKRDLNEDEGEEEVPAVEVM